MPQLDIINIVSFVILLCSIMDLLFVYFLGKVKTFIVFVFSAATVKSFIDNNFVNFLFLYNTAVTKKQHLKKFVTVLNN